MWKNAVKISVVVWICILLMSWASCAHAGIMWWGILGGASSAVCTDANPVGNCTGFVLCQNFQTATTGWDNSETWSVAGTVDPVSTSPALRGTQSASIANSSSISHALSDLAEFYAFARWQFADVTPSAGTTFFKANHGGSQIGSIILNTNGKLSCGHGVSTNTASTALSNTTMYYIWFHHKSDPAGLAGIMTAEVSTTRDYADVNAALGCSVTNGADTDAHTSLLWLQANVDGGAGISIDQILVKETEIGTVCE